MNKKQATRKLWSGFRLLCIVCCRLNSVFCALLAACCLLLTFYFSRPSAFAANPSPFAADKLTNQRAPDFTLKDVKGVAFSLSSYKGRVVLLNFWATWCPACKEEMPSMNKLGRQFKNRKFSIIAVSTDRSVADVREFLKGESADFTVLVDESLSVSKFLYKVFALPTSYLIDKKGVIVEKYFGEENWTDPELVRKIEGYINK